MSSRRVAPVELDVASLADDLRISRRAFLAGSIALGCTASIPSAALAAAQQAATQSAAGEPVEALQFIAATNPALNAIVTDVIHHAQYAFAVAASGQTASARNRLVGACATFTAARKPRTREAYRRGATALMKPDNRDRAAYFGRYAKIAPAALAGMTPKEAVAKAGGPPVQRGAQLHLGSLRTMGTAGANFVDLLDPEAVKAMLAAEKSKAAKDQYERDKAAGAKYKQIEFFITQVKCIEQTSGALEGNDEIALAGIAIGAGGHKSKIKQFRVKDEFDSDSDGNTKNWKKGRHFCGFEIDTSKPWPHTYTVLISMAELDDGGFGDFLDKLWDAVGTLVSQAIGDTAAAEIGAAIGSALGGLGAVIGAVVGAIIGWLISLFHNSDDLLGTKTRHINLYSDTLSYYQGRGLTTHEGLRIKRLRYNDDGDYRVECGWRLMQP